MPSLNEYETTWSEEVTLEHYLTHVALFTNADSSEPGDKIKLMIVHTAKGLEFLYVFLCGLNEGLFPSCKVRTMSAMEEDRRLAFVALTRAAQSTAACATSPKRKTVRHSRYDAPWHVIYQRIKADRSRKY